MAPAMPERDHRIFDGRGALLRRQEAAALSPRNDTTHRIFLLGRRVGRDYSSAIKWDTSGTSAGGMS